MNQLQLTFLEEEEEEQEKPPLTAGEIADEFGPNAGLFYRYRAAKAREKAAREEAEALRPEICELLDNGELVGIEGAGFLTYQAEERVSFDWKTALEFGLFSMDEAVPFLNRTSLQKLVTKRWGEE